MAEFLTRWKSLGTELGCAVAAWDDVGDDLVTRHGEAHRSYHVARHIDAVVGHLDQLTSGRPAPAQVLAAFFHDAVYDPRRSDNEVVSARLAAESLEPFDLDAGLIADACRIIEATAGHEAADEPLVEVFLDADLAVLGAPPAVYDSYAAGIAEEYSHMAPEDFRAGRRHVLDHFLGRGNIFSTSRGRELFEEQARLNLARERSAL